MAQPEAKLIRQTLASMPNNQISKNRQPQKKRPLPLTTTMRKNLTNFLTRTMMTLKRSPSPMPNNSKSNPLRMRRMTVRKKRKPLKMMTMITMQMTTRVETMITSMKRRC